MIGGIIIQMVIMVLYSFLFVSFALHWKREKVSWRLGRKSQGREAGSIHSAEDIRKAKQLMFGLALATLFVFIRYVPQDVSENGPDVYVCEGPSSERLSFPVAGGLLPFLN